MAAGNRVSAISIGRLLVSIVRISIILDIADRKLMMESIKATCPNALTFPFALNTEKTMAANVISNNDTKTIDVVSKHLII